MRFDDRLVTILKQPTDSVGARSIAWGQLVDLLAQAGDDLPNQLRTAAFAKLDEWREAVPIVRRRFAAQTLAGRINAPRMALFFGQDNAVVAAPLLSRVHLSDDAWLEMIPRLPPTSRALLRERRDLPESADRLLRSYGPGDNALPSGLIVRETISGSEAPIQIRDLVARIEAFKQERSAEPPRIFESPPIENQLFDQSDSFRFESDRTGVLCWIEGAPRGSLIGLSLAELAEPRSFGVDGHAAGAFRKRAAFRDARLVAPGTGPVAGDWLISADPLFDSGDGRFLGYRGLARRPERGELAQSSAFAPFGQGVSADSIRQLVHELRSPLNAIRGFAEMIEGQILGPVSHPYRDHAQKIIENSVRLVSVVEDLDIAARLQNNVDPVTPGGSFDVMTVLGTLLTQLRPNCLRRSIELTLSKSTMIPFAAINGQSGERLIERFLNTVIGLSGPGEIVAIDVRCQSNRIELTIGRPQLLVGHDDLEITDFATVTEAKWPDPPALGLDFTIRLIKHMARSVEGQFRIDADKFVLILPSVRDSAGATKESG